MKFGFLLFPELEEQDFVGPWEIIGMWGKKLQCPEECLTNIIFHSGFSPESRQLIRNGFLPLQE